MDDRVYTTCIVCKKTFEINRVVNPHKTARARVLRRHDSVTCSKICSKVYERIYHHIIVRIKKGI